MKKRKQHAPRRENLSANQASNNRLLSKVYQELFKLNSKKKKIRKWGKDMNRYFKEVIKMANNLVRRSQHYYPQEKCKSEPQLTYQNGYNKINDNTKRQLRCGRNESLIRGGWEYKMGQPLCKTT